MIDASLGRLLAADDLPPVEGFNRSGASPFLLTGDHAGNAVPRKLDRLGLAPGELDRHIGWDIGVRALGIALAERLDAVFLAQRYSRLVIDCNRDPASAEAILAESDGAAVPGNIGLSAAQVAQRVDEIHAPYHDAIAQELRARAGAGPVVMIALHSFTPRLAGVDRPWAIGVLHGGHDDAFARPLLAALGARGGFAVGDNQPYRLDTTDHSIPRHAFDPDLPYAEIEIRQDLLQDAAEVARWTEICAACFADAYAQTRHQRGEG